jgi:hypothetical protein
VKKINLILISIGIGSLLLVSGGCSLLRKPVTSTRVVSENERLIQSVMEINRIEPFLEYRFTGRSRLDGETMGFAGSLKMAKDSLIWVSLRSTLGIEIARVLVTPDSVWLNSKFMKIKEKGDWKLVREWTGYGLDFYALQGILTQSLFMASGNSENILQDLTSRVQQNETWIGWKPEIEDIPTKNKYLAQFRIDPGTRKIQEIKMKDGVGQWVCTVLFEYVKDNLIKKIELNGMDESHTYSAEITIVTVERKESIEYSFEKF